jgi:5-methyltetrahydropteroyltriglutamate--homocysteine methyltransferase
MVEFRHLLPTSVIGSHGLPGWVWLAREAMAEGRLGPLDEQEILRDATRVAMLDQIDAGVDVISTGEMGRLRFIIGFYDHFTGIEQQSPARRLGAPHWDTNSPYHVVDKISAPEGLGVVDEFKMARAMTKHALKATVPGPFTLSIPLRLVSGYPSKDEMLADLIAIVNVELRGLIEAGAEFIQIDEPNYAMHQSGKNPPIHEVYNAATEGIDAKLGLHICFGNLYGRHFPAERTYRHLFPDVLQVKADQLALEFAAREMAELGLWRAFASESEIELAAGLVDVKGFRADSPELVARRIRQVLEFVAPERLWITPDCGFWETPRHVAVAKLKAMVEGARIVREELAG